MSSYVRILNAINTYALYKDKQLVSLMCSKMDTPRFINTPINTVLAYLYCVQENQIVLHELYMEFDLKMDEKLANALVDLILHNQSVTKLDLLFQEWDPLILNKILKAVDTSTFIQSITICDLSLKETGKFLAWFTENTKDSLSRSHEISTLMRFSSCPAVKCIFFDEVDTNGHSKDNGTNNPKRAILTANEFCNLF